MIVNLLETSKTSLFIATLIIGLGPLTPTYAQDNDDTWYEPDEPSTIRRDDERPYEDDLSVKRGPRPRRQRVRSYELRDEDRESRDEELAWDDRYFANGRFRFSAMIIPYIDIDADRDSGEKRQGIEFDDSIRAGSGLAIRFGVGTEASQNGLYGNLGLLYIYTEQETRNFRATVHAHQGYLEGIIGLRGGSRVIRAYIEAGFGLGGVGLDFKRGLDDKGGAAILGRLSLGLSFMEQVSVGASLGFLEFGYPTETIGRAQFGSVDLKLDF
jgi:hypothetical protein